MAKTKYNTKGEVVQWVADSKARRVPLFVTAMIHQDSALEIRRLWGEGAVFVKGKPAPRRAVRKAPKAKAKPVRLMDLLAEAGAHLAEVKARAGR